MRILILIGALVLLFAAQADTVQWSKGYTANCDNATERVDLDPTDNIPPTPLALDEIARVEYYLDMADGNITNPALTLVMDGGCKAMFLDTKALLPGDYFAYGRTFTTDGLDSVASAPGNPKKIQKARPKPASNFR